MAAKNHSIYGYISLGISVIYLIYYLILVHMKKSTLRLDMIIFIILINITSLIYGIHENLTATTIRSIFFLVVFVYFLSYYFVKER